LKSATFHTANDNNIILEVSTISIAEYCVRGSLDELPLMNVQIIPFNLDHANPKVVTTTKACQKASQIRGNQKFCHP